MNSRIILFLFGFFRFVSAFSQQDIAALRYSQTTLGGTARFTGMGGTFGALGSDPSAININPAGLSLFKKNEISFTPSFFSSLSSSDYNGINTDNRKSDVNIGSAGLIIDCNCLNKDSSDFSYKLGITYSRIADFHGKTDIIGLNSRSSLLDNFLKTANGKNITELDPFSEKLAFSTHLLDTIPGNPARYRSAVPFAGALQREFVETEGRIGQTDISFSAGYKNLFHFGASIGIFGIKYIESYSYRETDNNDTIPDFNAFSFYKDMDTRGTGINFKLGAIASPSNWFNIGATFHSPVYYSLSDQYSNRITSSFDNGITFDESANPEHTKKYSLSTPAKGIVSVAFTVPKKALISMDYEYLNYYYTRLHFQPEESAVDNTNKLIQKKYSGTSNIRIGGELKFDPVSIRAGYAIYGSPYREKLNYDDSRKSYTLGLGITKNNCFLDLSYVYTKYSEEHYFYSPSENIAINPAMNNFRCSSFLVTIGFRFASDPDANCFHSEPDIPYQSTSESKPRNSSINNHKPPKNHKFPKTVTPKKQL